MADETCCWKDGNGRVCGEKRTSAVHDHSPSINFCAGNDWRRGACPANNQGCHPWTPASQPAAQPDTSQLLLEWYCLDNEDVTTVISRDMSATPYLAAQQLVADMVEYGACFETEEQALMQAWAELLDFKRGVEDRLAKIRAGG